MKPFYALLLTLAACQSTFEDQPDTPYLAQSFALAPTGGCFTDTELADFELGTVDGTDTTSSPGEVVLAMETLLDQENTDVGTSGVGITQTVWGGQTWTPSVSGTLTRATIHLFCSGCTGTTPNLALSVRATSDGLPTGADLASATIAGFSSGADVSYSATFENPVAVTAGTQYALVIRPTANPSPGTYALTRSGTATVGKSPYDGGTRVVGRTSGTEWSIPLTGGESTDAGFAVFIDSDYQTNGDFTSSTKDRDPGPDEPISWGPLNATATTPAGTTLTYQVAVSDSPSGPFDFVGPDGTSDTFFAPGDSLAQFNGKRYLQYRALFTTDDQATTPVLNEVTICFLPTIPTSLVVSAATGAYGGKTVLSAMLSAAGSPVAGDISFSLDGTTVGSASTDESGVATLGDVNIPGIAAGTATIVASYAGDATHDASTGTGTLTVTQAVNTIVFEALANKVHGDAPFMVSATGQSSQVVVFSTTSNTCSITDATVTILDVGTCTILANQQGDANFLDADEVAQSFDITAATQHISFEPIAPFPWNTGPVTLKASATSTLSITYGHVSGPCTVSGDAMTPLGAGTCVVSADQEGNASHLPAPQVTLSVVLSLAPQTISFSALADRDLSSGPFDVSATGGASSNPVVFSVSGACSVAGVTVSLHGEGTCTISANQAGSADYEAAQQVTQSFAITHTAVPEQEDTTPAGGCQCGSAPGGPVSSLLVIAFVALWRRRRALFAV